MTIVVVTPPEPIVTVEEAKRQCRIDHSDDDDVLGDLVAAVSAEIEPPGSWVGRAFGVQTLEQRFEGFPCSPTWRADLVLRCPPLRSIVSVSYDDANGAPQVLDPSLYTLVGAGGTDVARVALAYGQAWPAVRYSAESVRVRFQAGYLAGDPQLLPAKQAVLLTVGFLYANREASPADALAGTAERLLSRYRVFA